LTTLIKLEEFEKPAFSFLVDDNFENGGYGGYRGGSGGSVEPPKLNVKT